jgi:hypothetical protein
LEDLGFVWDTSVTAAAAGGAGDAGDDVDVDAI